MPKRRKVKRHLTAKLIRQRINELKRAIDSHNEGECECGLCEDRRDELHKLHILLKQLKKKSKR